MSFVVVFSKATGRIRSIFIPDNDAQIKDLNYLDGEDHIILDDKQKASLPELQEIVSKQTGLIPKDDRYVVVDKSGNIAGVLLADPLCGDKIPDCELIAHATATTNWTYDEKEGFKEPVKTPEPPPDKDAL